MTCVRCEVLGNCGTISSESVFKFEECIFKAASHKQAGCISERQEVLVPMYIESRKGKFASCCFGAEDQPECVPLLYIGTTTFSRGAAALIDITFEDCSFFLNSHAASGTAPDPARPCIICRQQNTVVSITGTKTKVTVFSADPATAGNAAAYMFATVPGNLVNVQCKELHVVVVSAALHPDSPTCFLMMIYDNAAQREPDGSSSSSGANHKCFISFSESTKLRDETSSLTSLSQPGGMAMLCDRLVWRLSEDDAAETEAGPSVIRSRQTRGFNTLVLKSKYLVEYMNGIRFGLQASQCSGAEMFVAGSQDILVVKPIFLSNNGRSTQCISGISSLSSSMLQARSGTGSSTTLMKKKNKLKLMMMMAKTKGQKNAKKQAERASLPALLSFVKIFVVSDTLFEMDSMNPLGLTLNNLVIEYIPHGRFFVHPVQCGASHHSSVDPPLLSPISIIKGSMDNTLQCANCTFKFNCGQMPRSRLQADGGNKAAWCVAYDVHWATFYSCKFERVQDIARTVDDEPKVAVCCTQSAYSSAHITGCSFTGVDPHHRLETVQPA